MGGPSDNLFTAYDSICRGALCRAPGYPQISVNLSNLALYVGVTDLPFGGPAPGFSFDRAFNMDNTQAGPFGIGWSYTLGDTLTIDSDGSIILSRSTGRVDRFAASDDGLVPVTATSDTLVQNSNGTYTLSTPGSPTTRVFSSGGLLLAIQNSGTPLVTVNYNSSGQLTTALYRGSTINFTYDGSGHITTVADSAGRTVGYSYSGNQLVQTTDADGQTVTYQYDGSGNLVAIAYGPATIAIAYNSDPPFNSVSGVTTPDGATRQYGAPLLPEQIQFTDGNGNVALYVSAAQGLLQSVTDANGNTVSYTYDASGRRTSVTNGTGQTSTFAYDANENLTAVTDSAGDRWQASYAPSGPGASPARITDPDGNVWTLKYNAAGSLVSVTDPHGGVTSASLTAAGQIAGLTNPDGDQTAYQYNSNGLLATYTDPLGGMWSYQYDAAARPSARTDPGGAVLQAGYGAGTAVTSLTAGSATIAVNLSGIQRDALNRLTSYTDSFGNQIAYTYDAAGNLTSMTLPGGNTVTYQYDHANRLVMVADWVGNFALYRYDAANFPLSMNASGGPVAIYQYDNARRLRAIVSTGPDGATVAGYNYTYDAAGNRLTVSALEPFAGAPPITDFTATVNAEGDPVSRSDNQVFQYDARGNLTVIQGYRTVSAAYDPFGRLQNFTAANATAYTYDSTGLRVALAAPDGTGSRFVYDLSGPQPRVVMETDSDDSPVAWYVYGLGLLWQVTPGGATYFYHFDGEGNVVALSNPAQGVVNQYRYDPQGHLAAANETVGNMFRERGESGWIDDGNGLVFTGALYQFPAVGLTLPSTANPSPPVPILLPSFPGAGACLIQGVPGCAFPTAGRYR